MKNRFLFVDGLRGIAAISVVIYHFHGAVKDYSPNWAHKTVDLIFSYGYLGVDIFFVISGFVISYSISNYRTSFRFLGRFALRRSIRLDPPYWITIAAELILIFISTQFLSKHITEGFPELKVIVSHLFYAQDFLRYGGILSIFWTLCFEIQFYLFFVTSLIITQFFTDNFPKRFSSNIISGLAAALFIYSVLTFYVPTIETLPGLFIPRWFQFFVGYLAMRAVSKQHVTIELIAALAIIILASVIYVDGAGNGLAAAISTILIVAAGLKPGLGKLLTFSPIQFLGKISYSLYLIHLVIGWRAIRFLGFYLNENPSTLVLWAIFFTGIASSILSAWLMYVLIESPSLKICRSVALDKKISWLKLQDSIKGWIK